ncbi:MAG TPA: hypothetical protein VFJ16_26415 [Longimicrobium sp.]|nr:hypothetical protein [Longimicrobium sp.]
MERRDTPAFGTLLLVILAFAAFGIPLFLYLWETVNGLLEGHGGGMRLLFSIPVLALFVALLAVLARTVRRWEAPAPLDRS